MELDNGNCVPKLIGGDVELGNFIVGAGVSGNKSDYEASRILLSRVEGLPRQSFHGSSYASHVDLDLATLGVSRASSHYADGSSQDWGRKYSPANGGCIYIDLNHLELATPEVLSAADYTAVWGAMLRMARTAQQSANADLAPERSIVVLANNSDRQGNSYGGHQSFLMSRVAFDGIVRSGNLPNLHYLSSHQVSSIVFAGQGKVGSENNRPAVPYQISQRADFIECLLGEQTTYHRPLINTRDEPLCGHSGLADRGNAAAYARLHVIFYDTNLAPVATFLKVGVQQLILAMIEADFMDPGLPLKRPLDALHAWSADLDLSVRMPVVSGAEYTAVELQLKLLEQAKAFDAERGFDGVVADSARILTLWEDTLVKLEARNFAALRGRLDWVMKRSLLEEALAENSDLSWESPEITYLDQIYSSLDPANGLFLGLQAQGHFEEIVSEAQIASLTQEPPGDTRAWTRAMLLRAAGPDRVAHVDWDRIELFANGRYGNRVVLHLADPLAASRDMAEAVFVGADDFASLVAALEEAGVITIGVMRSSTASTSGLVGTYGPSEVH